MVDMVNIRQAQKDGFEAGKLFPAKSALEIADLYAYTDKDLRKEFINAFYDGMIVVTLTPYYEVERMND